LRCLHADGGFLGAGGLDVVVVVDSLQGKDHRWYEGVRRSEGRRLRPEGGRGALRQGRIRPETSAGKRSSDELFRRPGGVFARGRRRESERRGRPSYRHRRGALLLRQ
jgi:hypothetical protein